MPTGKRNPLPVPVRPASLRAMTVVMSIEPKAEPFKARSQ